MAKKRKKAVVTYPEPIPFRLEEQEYRLLRFDPNTMTVTVERLSDGTRSELPFAHLPRTLKARIRPL